MTMGKYEQLQYNHECLSETDLVSDPGLLTSCGLRIPCATCWGLWVLFLWNRNPPNGLKGCSENWMKCLLSAGVLLGYSRLPTLSVSTVYWEEIGTLEEHSAEVCGRECNLARKMRHVTLLGPFVTYLFLFYTPPGVTLMHKLLFPFILASLLASGAVLWYHRVDLTHQKSAARHKSQCFIHWVLCGHYHREPYIYPV